MPEITHAILEGDDLTPRDYLQAVRRALEAQGELQLAQVRAEPSLRRAARHAGAYESTVSAIAIVDRYLAGLAMIPEEA